MARGTSSRTNVVGYSVGMLCTLHWAFCNRRLLSPNAKADLVSTCTKNWPVCLSPCGSSAVPASRFRPAMFPSHCRFKERCPDNALCSVSLGKSDDSEARCRFNDKEALSATAASSATCGWLRQWQARQRTGKGKVRSQLWMEEILLLVEHTGLC